MSSNSRPPQKSVRQWDGQWIWCKGEAKPYHFYLYARKTFILDDKPTSAQLHITASDRYVLYVNGRYLGRGPARSDPRRKSYDTYDVAASLQKGANVIGVRAYHYGMPARGEPRAVTQYFYEAPLVGEGWGSWTGGSYSIGERAGLWVQLDITAASGAKTVVASDETWRTRPAQAWNRSVRLINSLLGSTEVFDANTDPTDWMSLNFDDSDWEPAWELPTSDLEWFLLEARELPMLLERNRFPTAVMEAGELVDLALPGQIDIPELMGAEPHFPHEYSIIEDVDALLNGDEAAATFQNQFVEGKGLRAPYILIDFGRQVFGFPRVRMRAPRGAMLDMTYGQQIQAGRIPPAVRYGDRYIAREGQQIWEVSEYKQFRYLQLTVRSNYQPLTIESVSVNEYVYPADERGNVNCSDAMLSNLWRACVDTTYLHMEDTLVCDAYRERVPWPTGDGGHGLYMLFAAYGDLPLADRYLRMAPLSGRGDGMLQMVYPPNNPTRGVHPQFQLQWSSRVRDHYLFTGRRWVVEELYPSVVAQIDWFEPHRDASGLLRDLPLQNTIDWVPNDFRGTSFITNALYVKGLEDAAWLADEMGAARDAERWRGSAAHIKAALRELHWNEARSLFVDSYREGRASDVTSELTNGFALLYGIASDEQASGIAARLAAPEPDLLRASPLWFGYVADGLFARGHAQAALDLTRARFKTMLEASDAPTMWELWDPFTGGLRITTEAEAAERTTVNLVQPKPLLSLVHTGGTLIGYLLVSRILGVTPTGPGFETCRIHPQTADLDWARGVVPTPKGNIEVEWSRADERLNLTVAVPQTINAELILDWARTSGSHLRHNETAIDLGDAQRSSAHGITVRADAIQCRLPGGRHTFELATAPGHGRP